MDILTKNEIFVSPFIKMVCISCFLVNITNVEVVRSYFISSRLAARSIAILDLMIVLMNFVFRLVFRWPKIIKEYRNSRRKWRTGTNVSSRGIAFFNCTGQRPGGGCSLSNGRASLRMREWNWQCPLGLWIRHWRYSFVRYKQVCSTLDGMCITFSVFFWSAPDPGGWAEKGQKRQKREGQGGQDQSRQDQQRMLQRDELRSRPGKVII